MAVAESNCVISSNPAMGFTRSESPSGCENHEPHRRQFDEIFISTSSNLKRLHRLISCLEEVLGKQIVCHRSKQSVNIVLATLRETADRFQTEIFHHPELIQTEINRILSIGMSQLKHIKRCETCRDLLDSRTDVLGDGNRLIRYLRKQTSSQNKDGSTNFKTVSADRKLFCQQWLQSHTHYVDLPSENDIDMLGCSRFMEGTPGDLQCRFPTSNDSKFYKLEPTTERWESRDRNSHRTSSESFPIEQSIRLPYHVSRMQHSIPRFHKHSMECESNNSSPLSQSPNREGRRYLQNRPATLKAAKCSRLDSSLWTALSSMSLCEPEPSPITEHRNSRTLRFLASMSPRANIIPPPNLNPFAQNSSI